MKKFQAKKKLLFSCLILLLVVAGVYGYGAWQLYHLNSNPEFDEIPDNMLASFPAGPGNSMTPVSGNLVYFDLGSRHSFITRNAVARLKDMGFEPKIDNVLIYTTDADGHFGLYTKKVTIDITIPNPNLPDSLYTIRNVELLLVDNDKHNVFGMDLIKHFVIERLWPENIINIYREVPAGYYQVTGLDMHNSPFGNYIGSTGRASIELTVNDDDPRDYFLDSGGNMVDVELVQPESQMHMATTRVEVDSLTGLYTQRQCRVAFGDRLRYSNVVYCDSLHTDDYSVNPLKLFDQDVVLDIPGRRLMIHKTRD